MQKLYNDLSAFSDEVIKFQHELEDNYESPVLAKTLRAYRVRVKAFIEYTPTFTGNFLEVDDQKAIHYNLSLALVERLNELDGIDKNSNVFDIIEVVRKLYNTLELYMPENRDTVAPIPW